MPMYRALVASLLFAGPAVAQNAEPARRRVEVAGYAIANYFNFSWQTDPRRRAVVDLERFVLESAYDVSPRLRFETELEVEHGGTGSTMEFDPFEEFGEFEQEIEKGGEVVLEKLEATFTIHPAFNVRVGRMYVPLGLVTAADDPDEYFSNTRNEAESALIPTIWHEAGVGAFGTVGAARYQVALITGLDATGFSSATWIRRGHQKRFEMVNAEDLAIVGRIDLALGERASVGGSLYHGNSAGNRPKADLTVPANVTIMDAHATASLGGLSARALVLYGRLQNADLVSAANRNLSNNLNVKRTPVGSAALGWFVELGYDVLSAIQPAGATGHTPLILFARYDWYDTMFRVTGDVFDNPRWDRSVVTAGLNWLPDPHFIVKASYARRTLGLATANRETTVALGVAAIF